MLHFLPADCAKAGVIKADAVLIGAAQVKEKAVNEFPDD